MNQLLLKHAASAREHLKQVETPCAAVGINTNFLTGKEEKPFQKRGGGGKKLYKKIRQEKPSISTSIYLNWE